MRTPESGTAVQIAEILTRSAKMWPVTLCIVNYNGRDVLEETLEAALSCQHGFAEVLLIDAGSTDESVEFVRRRFPNVQVVALAANRGPGAARNAGFQRSATDLVLFLDNDVLLAPGCAERLARALDERQDAVIAVPRVLYRRDPDIIQYDGAGCHFLGMMSLRNAEIPADMADVGVREIDSVVSACFLVDRRRWSGGPLFDERFFIYQEDHDLGLRTRLAGGRILAVPEAQCLHGDGTPGLSLRATGRYQPLRVVAHIRNRWLILLKNYHWRTLILLGPVLVAYEASQLGAVVSKRWYREWLQAVAATLSALPDLLRQRRTIQRRRRTPDGEVLHGGPLPFAPQLAQGRLDRAGLAVLNAVCVGYWRGIRRFL